MMRNKKIYIEILAFLIFFYFLFVLPFFDNINIDVFSTVLFLNFDNFNSLQLEKFNIQYIVVFILLFQIVCFQNITVLINNVTYLSMALHKLGKKKQILLILIENGKTIGLIYIYMVICIWGIGMFVFFQSGNRYEYSTCIQITIYLLKYFVFIYTILTIHHIKCIIKESHYLIIQSYFLFIGMVLCDMMLGTHLITLSNTITIEIVSLLLMGIFSIIAIILISNNFKNAKEVYND